MILSIDEIVNLHMFTAFHFSNLILSIDIFLDLSLCFFIVKKAKVYSIMWQLI